MALQDWVLARLRQLEHGFYLTGGTALARGYYQHRYSEDLDFFVNDAPEFELWRDRCLDALQHEAAAAGMKLQIVLREERYGRAVLHGTTALKLEFVNDVPFRVGQPWEHPELGRLDTRENILANKISALVDRAEPKDVADVYWLCCRDNLDLVQAVENAGGKAAGIFPPVVAEALVKARDTGVPKVFWIVPPDERDFRAGLERLINQIMS
ncbi:MAG: nucleotidyl transferase AbiEii/AbiGii toxin family protein [Verrucomicrobiae bacterium]|nr:nucleotidyl transferase AbiEii/AbiGii toxin family protein [Verrucomicrobiae bacterium]